MNESKVLKPAPGVKVRRPDGARKHLAEAGEEVTMSSYWRRRLAAGDVVEVAPAKAVAEVKPAPAGKGNRE